MNNHDKEVIERLKTALGIARMAIAQGATLQTRTAGNGPTVGDVISSALAVEEDIKVEKKEDAVP